MNAHREDLIERLARWGSPYAFMDAGSFPRITSQRGQTRTEARGEARRFVMEAISIGRETATPTPAQMVLCVFAGVCLGAAGVLMFVGGM